MDLQKLIDYRAQTLSLIEKTLSIMLCSMEQGRAFNLTTSMDTRDGQEYLTTTLTMSSKLPPGDQEEPQGFDPD